MRDPFLLGEWAYVCTGGGFVPLPCEPVAGPARRWSFTRDSVFRSTVDGEVVDEGRFRIVPLEIEPGTTDLMLEVDGVRTSTVLSMPTVNELVSSRRCPDCSYSEWARVR